jgi:hypothetical protein
MTVDRRHHREKEERMKRVAILAGRLVRSSLIQKYRRGGRVLMIRIRPRRVATRSPKPLRALPATAAVFLMVLLGASAAVAAGPNTGFGFNAPNVAGFPTGEVVLTGGGAFNSSTGFVHSGGGFTCTSQVSQGPLAGCLTGEGVRWDTAALLADTTFKCTGSPSEALKSASTNDDTVVLQADFYRAGDGIDESFTAKMIVSAADIAPDIPGDQNVWVQGVGCATAVAHFSS